MILVRRILLLAACLSAAAWLQSVRAVQDADTERADLERERVRLQAQLDQQLQPLGLRAIERAAVSSGERIIDVGCGCGETTLELARRTGPDGAVLGLDLSAAALQSAAVAARQHALNY